MTRNLLTAVRWIWLILCAHTAMACGPATAQDSLERDYGDELPRIAPREPADALSLFEVNPGLKIELIAAEPLVNDPVAIDFDELGRAFVAEMRGYSEQTSDRLGRIRLLVDRDADGRFDSSTIFADRLSWPTAVICCAGGILVGDAPHIIFFKDLDDDGQADLRQIVWTGFGTANVQQLLNNFHWGIDNRIYGAAGGNGGRVQRAELAHEFTEVFGADPNQGVESIDLRGRDFVIDPLTLTLSAASGGGQFGMAFDRWGNRFVCSNSDHCQQIVLEDRYLARNPLLRAPSPRVNIAVDGPAAPVFRISPIEPWRVVRTRLRVQGLVSGPIEGGGRAAGYFTSAAGISIYDGDALPENYRGDVFVGDVGSNLVHRKTLRDEGIVKSAARAEPDREFLRSTDNWFRPVQCTSSPHGSLVILDMYREIVEHPASLPPIIKQHLDLVSGNDRGRIYRVVPDTFTPPQRRWPGAATDRQLVDMLTHPNGWHRRTAARLLGERRPDVAVPLLRTASVESDNPETRIRSMYLLADFHQLDPEILVKLLDDPHSYVRVHALRVAERYIDRQVVRQRVLAMVNDEDVRVRLQVALTLGNLNDDGAAVAIAGIAARDGSDRWMQAALASSATGCRAQVLDALVSAHDSRDARHLKWPLVRELARQIGRDATADHLDILAHRLVDLRARDPDLLGLLLLALLEGPPTQFERLSAALQKSQQLTLDQLIGDAIAQAQTVATDRVAPPADRSAAIAVLRLCDDAKFQSQLRELMDIVEPPEVKRAAIETASHFRDARIIEPILDELRSLNPALRGQALQVALSRDSWTQRLLDRIESEAITPVWLGAPVRQQLLRHPQRDVRERAAQILAGDAAQKSRAEIVDRYAAALSTLTGDADRGREVFRKSCVACHRLKNEGSEIGPNLAAFANRGAAGILVNVLDPNRDVDARYLSYTFLLDDGRLLVGMIASESASSISIQDVEGKLTVISRAEIEDMQSTSLSLMPENFDRDIDYQAMADLIAFLISQRG